MPKNALLPVKFVSAASLAGNVTSSPINIQQMDDIGIQVNFTGTPTGTFSVEVSLDYNVSTGNAGNWNAITLSPAVSAAGGPGSAYIDIFGISASFIRLIYTRTSGTGSLDAYIAAKGI